MSSNSLSIIQPDDWHLHLRDEASLSTTVPHSANTFGRAIIMPNLKPAVTTVAAAQAYRNRILDAAPVDSNFNPLMTLYLTDGLNPDEISRAGESECVVAVKYYPAGATTNSENGITHIEKAYPVLERLQDIGMPLLIHGEVTDPDVDIFDRELRFIEDELAGLTMKFPNLKIVLEHITTAQAVEFVVAQDVNIAATITVHHLLYNRNHLLAGGVRPHFYCLPILKRNIHQQALLKAATSGDPKFFLGTDSAPHSRSTKEASCGCAGVYSAPGALELYAEVFEQENALDKLEGFASIFGADFYGLPHNDAIITLKKQPWQMPAEFKFVDETIIPICAGEKLQWRIQRDDE